MAIESQRIEDYPPCTLCFFVNNKGNQLKTKFV